MAKWEPQGSDYGEAIRTQNPWQSLGSVPEELAPRTYRPLADVLWQAVLSPKNRRHHLILGPRRVGKTTVMYQTVRQLLESGIDQNRLWWLRLDHPLFMDWPLGEMMSQIIETAGATRDKPLYAFLDELTYSDRWDLWLKTFFDDRWPVRIVGTSSATAAIRQQGTESGVGRWEEQFLAPYLFTEYLDLKQKGVRTTTGETLGKTISNLIHEPPSFGGIKDLRRHFLLTGGFPELLVDEKRRTDDASELLRSQRVLRSDAIEKAVYKDIPQAFELHDPTTLERLLYILAGQITGIFSPNTIATDLGKAPATVERYIGYLERAFIIFTLNNYSASEETIQRRGKKVYFVDGAVRNAALLRGIMPIDHPAEMGLLIENMAASHLRALAYQEGIRLFHWRNKSDEVDFVFDHPDDPLAFELTNSTSHSTKGIRRFVERFPKFRGCSYLVVADATPKLPTFDAPGTIPLDMFIIAVGLQQQAALKARVGGTKLTSSGQLLLF